MIQIIEIRFHGRGGQGVVTAAEVLAVAAFLEGKHSQSFPMFGSERRGAPVTSFCRIDDKPIRVYQQIYQPDIVVVLDKKLSENSGVYAGVRPGSIVVLNSRKNQPNTVSVDASRIVLDIIGKPVYNIAMLGALIGAANVCSLESLKKAVRSRFAGAIAEKNILAAEECYRQVKKA